MKIGIIGAGHIGSALAKKLHDLNHDVRIANSRGRETLVQVSKETGVRPVDVFDAVKDVDLIVLTIPEKNVPELPKGLFKNVPDEIPVIDTGNYYPITRDGVMKELEAAPSESSWIAQTIGHPVIKVFNSIIAYSLAQEGKPPGAKDRIALPVSGDRFEAKKLVMRLVDDLGFDPIDAGSLADSWRQQPGTPAYCTNLTRDQLERALTSTNHQRSQQLRKLAEEKLKKLPPNSPPDAMVKIARELQKAA